MPEVGGRASPEVVRVGELSLPLLYCSTRESAPYITPGQHSRVGPKGVGVRQLKDKKAGELVPPLGHHCKG